MNIISCRAAKREYVSYQLHQFLYFIESLAGSALKAECQHSWEISNLNKPLLLHIPQNSINSYSLSQWKQSDIPCN